MKGTLRHRAGAWRLQVYAGRDPLTGKHRRLTATVNEPDTRAGRKTAEAALARMVLEVEDGKHSAATDNPTVAQLLERWTDARAADWSPANRAVYRVVIAAQIIPHIGDMRVRALRAHHLDRLYTDLRDHGARDGGPLAPGSVRKVHTILTSALGQARKWGIITINPADNATPPKAERSGVVDATVDEVRALLALAPLDFRILLLLAATTGARRGELCALRWDDIDFDAGIVTVRRALSDGGPGEGLVEKSRKAAGVSRSTLDAGTLAALRAYRAGVELDRAAIGARPPVYVFERPTGEPWRPDTTSDRWADLRRRAGVRPELRLHSVRHYVVSALLAAGFDARTVSDRVGWSNPSTMLSVYAHSLPARDREAGDVLGRALEVGP